PPGVVVVGNRGWSTLAHAAGGSDPLYLRSQAWRRPRDDERVFHASASGDAGGVLPQRLARGDGGRGGQDCGDRGGLGAGGGRCGGSAPDYGGRGRNRY